MPYPTVALDRVDQDIHNFEQTPAAAPVVQRESMTPNPISNVPAKPPQASASAPVVNNAVGQSDNTFPSAPKPDMEGMVRNVAKNQKLQQELSPEPSLPWNEIGKGLVGVIGTVAAGYLAHKALGGGNNNTPPDDNNPPNNGPKERSIKREPQMDVSMKGPVEPTLEPVVTEPTTPAAAKPVAEPETGLPKPTYPASSTQQSNITGYGQTTMNAPTGNPVVDSVAPPVAEVKPVIPTKEERDYITWQRKEQEAAARHARDMEKESNRPASSAKTTTPTVGTAPSTPINSAVGPTSTGEITNQIASTVDQDLAKTGLVKGQGEGQVASKDISILSNNTSSEPREQIKAELSDIRGQAGSAVAPESDKIPNYMQNKKKKNGTIEYKNKQGSDVIGKGGWNWYQGQMGPEAEKNWLNQFGRTNQSYADVKQAVKEGRLQGAEVKAGRGGSFPREATVPSYIRGSSSIKELAGLAAIATALGIGSSKQGQEAMSKAAAAIKDLGISPDIFANKGEELGRLGNSYINAGNPNYRAELQDQLKIEKDPQRRSELMRELKVTGGIPPQR